MNQLWLRLSNKIKATLIRNVKDTDYFAINKSFQIIHLFCDDKKLCFQEEITDSNFKLIHFDKVSGNLKIEYEGILDGTSGNYPYVKEKTSDDFYILRHETVYYPCFIRPDDEAYVHHLLEPDDSDRFEACVEMEDDRCVVSNLKEIDGCLKGFNPTFVIGNYHQQETFFGSIFYEDLKQEIIQKVEKIIYDTNDFMNHYKKAAIQDHKIIVIPEGYGSFVLPNTMFITEEGCNDARQLIHEIIHIHWNPLCEKHIQRARFFDEGLTQYFTYRVCDALHIQSKEETEKEYLHDFRNIMTTYEVPPMPIDSFADEELGALSYSFGALALIALEKQIGEEKMDEALSRCLKLYEKQAIDFDKFEALFPNEAKIVFDEYFRDETAAKRLLEDA